MNRLAHSTVEGCRHVRLPTWWTRVLVCLLCATYTPQAAALDDEYALGPIRPHLYSNQGQARQGLFIQCCVLIGGVAFTVSSSLLGPLTGISSMLWLMMRNDSAIDPRLAWMYVAPTVCPETLLTTVGYSEHGCSSG
jgi:hypothetical protein